MAALGSGVLPAAAPNTSDWRPQDVQTALRIGVRNKTLLAMMPMLRPLLSPADLALSENYRLLTFSKNAALLREIVQVCRCLSASRIVHIVIKGPIQSAAIHGDFMLRPASDIDILVAADDYSSGMTALAGLGYAPMSTSIWWRAFLGEQHLQKPGEQPITVDLHYRLQQPGSPPPRDVSAYLSKPGYSKVLDVDIPRLADADIPILSAISIVKALFNREHCGAHVYDLFAQVRPDVPQTLNTFLANADRQGLLGTSLLSLRIVEAAFGVKYSRDGEMAEILPQLSDDELVAMAFTPDDPELVWPRRRDVLWALCLRRPGQYAKEILRSIASETTLRLFERRPDAASA